VRWGALRLSPLLFGLWLVGCAPSQVFLSTNYTSPRKVAVLPVANESNDLDGPVMVRQLLFDQLLGRGWVLVPLSDVDEKLKEKGFTDGGQLRAATPQNLGEWTGADTLFYPVLQDFNYLNVGFYWQRRVKIAGRLVDAKTGERLWEAERAWATRELVTDKNRATREFAVQIAAKAIEKMTHFPLQAESRIAVDHLLATLPNR
jgi:hypothetical protein